jgi:hypothetical protein
VRAWFTSDRPGQRRGANETIAETGRLRSVSPRHREGRSWTPQPGVSWPIRYLLTRARPAVAHAVVATGFVALAAAWSCPLVLHLSTHLPGAGFGDNALFFWNFWWMRTALDTGANFFQTPYLFAPAGVGLTLHSHTALPAFVAATVFGHWSAVTAFNLTTLASLAMNGFAAYLLAWRLVQHRSAAVLAGIVFGTSPYVAAHLNGHINLINAWPLPLFALTFLDTIRGRRGAAVASGIVMGATVYVDYYYVVYEAVFACGALLLASMEFSLAKRPQPRPAWLMPVLCAAVVAAGGGVAGIGATGGFDGRLGPLALSVHGVFNPLQAAWLVVAVAAWLGLNRRLEVHRATARPAGVPGSLAIAALVSGVLAAPIAWGALQLAARGQYVSQQYAWRNAPVGIDLLTLLVGNPFNGLWGAPVQHLYSRMGINLIESVAWLGVAPLAAAAYASRRAAWSSVRTWVLLGGGFLTWSLGSYVHAAGANIGLLTPAVLVRYAPIAANARIPGRAIVMTYMAVAMLVAMGVAASPWRKRGVLVGALGALVLVDFMAAPFPLVEVACPPIYQVVRDRPERGALAELPLGVGDGFRDLTPVDHEAFVWQATHARPMVGGVVARLAPETLDAYRRDPLLAAWLRLSGMPGLEHAPLPDAAQAQALMQSDRIALVMVNRRRASAELRQYVERDLELRLVAQDGDRALYTAASQAAVIRR